MNEKRKTFKGFTLIEIIIGLAIISLLFLVGYAAYQEFARRQALNTAYSQVKSSLELAQQLALSGEKPSGCGANTLSGYQVSFYSDQNYFNIYAVCNSSVRVRRINLPPGITVPTLAVFYNVLAKGTTFPSNQDFTFTQASTGRTLNATITKEGSLTR